VALALASGLEQWVATQSLGTLWEKGLGRRNNTEKLLYYMMVCIQNRWCQCDLFFLTTNPVVTRSNACSISDRSANTNNTTSITWASRYTWYCILCSACIHVLCDVITELLLKFMYTALNLNLIEFARSAVTTQYRSVLICSYSKNTWIKNVWWTVCDVSCACAQKQFFERNLP
jgi:hypothetical protein